METLMKIMLVVHVITGFTGFFVAPVALAVKKGGNAHRQWGKVFFWSMTGAAGSALVMAPYKQNWFLTLVAVFSFYMAFSGYRAVYRKKVRNRSEIPLIDWVISGLNALFAVGLLILGITLLPDAFGYISIVFGLHWPFLHPAGSSFLPAAGRKQKAVAGQSHNRYDGRIHSRCIRIFSR
ncbi:MAG: hypothetical protein ACOJUL_10145 [Candidatus Pollutiaquabacter aromativorans]